ncbi:MAG: hypothetical protein AB7K52_02240 [Phycisphaerales bacterium]
MGTSQKTFDQVKSILGKLDRNIDSVRQRRLGEPPARPSPGYGATSGPALTQPGNVGGTVPGVIGPTLNTTIGAGPGVPPPATAAPPASKSGYGRAQPLRPEARSA